MVGTGRGADGRFSLNETNLIQRFTLLPEEKGWRNSVIIKMKKCPLSHPPTGDPQEKKSGGREKMSETGYKEHSLFNPKGCDEGKRGGGGS